MNDDDRLAMIKTNLDSLLANESNILNIADYEWLIAEVGRLRADNDRLRETLDKIDHYTYGWSFASAVKMVDDIRLAARAVLDGNN